MKSELDFSSLPVTCDSSKITIGSTFVACDGTVARGIDFIPQAITRGASQIVADIKYQELLAPLEKTTPTVIFSYVTHPRKALAEAAAAAHNYPAKKLRFIGITGTKGKSSITHLIEHMLRQAGHKTALIGGIANRIDTEIIPSNLTTPNSDFLQAFFAACVARHVDTVVMEVSSHALSLDRVHGIPFDVIGFTNLFNDHLDFYHTMDAYFVAKAALFKQLKPNGNAIINLDHPWGQQAIAAAKAHLPAEQIISLSMGEKAVAKLSLQRNDLTGLVITLQQQNFNKNLQLSSHNLFGTPYAYNIAMAALAAQACGVDAPAIANALQTFPGVPGRLQLHTLRTGAKAFVDFAHNGPAMEAVLAMLRPLTNNLIVLFGCGGDKPKERRISMPQAAARFADHIIITQDNPRTEDSDQILHDIEINIPVVAKTKTSTISDRREAIAAAAVLATTPSSIVAILGKGHERYQIIGTTKHHFDDFEEISKF